MFVMTSELHRSHCHVHRNFFTQAAKKVSQDSVDEATLQIGATYGMRGISFLLVENGSSSTVLLNS
jgi:hypothetical protein